MDRIYNFIDNAVDHTDSSKSIKVSPAQTGGSALFEVTDYGEGIAEADIPYMGEILYRLQREE